MNTLLLRGPPVRLFKLCDTSVAEDGFEQTVLWAFAHMYPDCVAFIYKPTIEYEGEGWQPDLALVDKKFRYWFVVEVETAAHSLQKHVLPQVTAFKRGIYGEEATKRLADGLGISLDEAGTIVTFVPRYVGVISNAHDDRWQSTLASADVQFISMSGYADSTETAAHYVVHGSFLAGERSLGFGTVKAMEQAIRVPKSEFWRDQTVYKITEPNGTANWTCHLANDDAWLIKNRGVVGLMDAAFVQFIQMADDSITLRLLSL